MKPVYFEHIGRKVMLSERAFKNGLEFGLIVKVGQRYLHTYERIVKHGKNLSTFVRLTKPKTEEQIQMKQMSSTLSEVVLINNSLSEVCPACEVGKPIDEVLEVYVN